MSKKYLGIICLLYSFIFGYVVLFDKLKLFLAPSMQIYIKLSIIPLFIIGLVILLNSNNHYKFKIIDLVLILPLILLIVAGNGRLSESFASNRATNFNNKNRVKTVEKKKEVKEEKEVLEEIDESYDFSNPYFDIVDSNYDGLSGYLSYVVKANKYEGKTIRVRGFALKDASYLPDEYFALGKYSVSCCVADAGFTGFFIKYDKSKITNNNWYEVEGILEKGKDKEGYDIMYIKVINIKEINSKKEEQYIYPCYAYEGDACNYIAKYGVEY